MPTLNWIGKDAVVKHHKEVPFRLLEAAPELSCGPADAGNLIVQGDNLLALNFVAHGALGGGVSRSLSVDNYGKALSAAILGFELLVPAALAPLLRRRAPG